MNLFYGWVIVGVGIVVNHGGRRRRGRFASTLGMALGPWAGGWLYDTFGGYFWLFLGSSGIGLGAVAIAWTFRPPRQVPDALPSPIAAH